ncbi:carboxylesterase type B [Thozetella sp. PMI_491]|nr:carboxylesterase type B [Thozetella sp. PMI_491]
MAEVSSGLTKYAWLIITIVAILFGLQHPAKPIVSPYEKFPVSTSASTNALVVDLGYEIYEGYENATSKINIWTGIRYAAPPVGPLRWQKPQVPASNRTNVLPAKETSVQCPQTNATLSFIFPEALLGHPTVSEDCLFLDVYAPRNAKNLPVLVYIHGGGYGEGLDSLDPSTLMNDNDNGFVTVLINYRLGAFGFLASDEVHRFGQTNAGLHDQTLALEWVQHYIERFGGDKTKVTIAGLSAGGGSVLLQSIAYGGTRGPRLFQNIIAASPYLPEQWHYSDYIPSQSYYRFAKAAGCLGSVNITAFDCLVRQNFTTLLKASEHVSTNGKYGTWGFLPVTDGDFLKTRPSLQLFQRRINAKRALVTYSADEGVQYTPQNIVTEDDFLDYVHTMFPLLDGREFDELIQHYPSTHDPVDPNIVPFATTGTHSPSALNMSVFGTGQQQRANNLYGESTFVCPAYWIAEAFSSNWGMRRSSWLAQFSVVSAEHGTGAVTWTPFATTAVSMLMQPMPDLLIVFPPDLPSHGPGLEKVYRSMYGNFIKSGSPSISIEGPPSSEDESILSRWPPYSPSTPVLLNLNQTGGVLEDHLSFENNLVKWYVEPGLRNDFRFANAYTWEAGRGARCDFWRRIGRDVPE